MKKFAVFCSVVVVLVALWGLWYIGGNTRENGRQWCATNEFGSIYCSPTLSACEHSTQDIRVGRCMKLRTSELFYCGYYGSNFSCFLTRNACSRFSSGTCELMTYDQAKTLDSNHTL